jgi:DNA-binding MarR family transcriptional regulator
MQLGQLRHDSERTNHWYAPSILEDLTSYLLSQTGRKARQRMAEQLSLGEVALLARLAEGPKTQRELGQRLRKDPADMVRLLDTAAEDGLVTRAPDPADRRRRLVSLTADGEATLRVALEIAGGIDEELLAPLSEAERRTLRALLTKLAR